MDYRFKEIEEKWQKSWKENKVYQVSNQSNKPKYYVLDMFPYPSGAGLHVGHPLGYIASDIYSRYKRLKGFNVLHPMGFDSFGLPAEQYAIETGQHPAETTKNNIATFKSQLDKIGFCYDWEREVQTSDPNYYKWTQKLFLELFNSYFCNTCKSALPISALIKKYETKGSSKFSAEQWNQFSVAEKEEWLMKRRLAYSSFGEVNWCQALGTVLANDEVVNGVSERGGHPVIKKKMRQWYLRITSYADRLLEGLERVDFSESMKEMQRNWIGRSEGAEIIFNIKPPLTPPVGENKPTSELHRQTARSSTYGLLKELSKEHKQNPTAEENILWQYLRAHQMGHHIRRQHIIDQYIVDFVCLDKRVTIEVDGGYYNNEEQKKYDESRTAFLNELDFEELRFTNEEVKHNIDKVVEIIIQKLNSKPSVGKVSPSGGDLEGASLVVYTTRPDTIFGVDFMVIAPEHELVAQITTAEQKAAIDEYVHYVKSRSDRERQAEVKQITGCFTGAYAINPFNQRQIPIWIAEYVLAGYGTGAIMAVPCGDERDFKFANHFNIPITNIIGEHYTGKEANPTKEAILENSDFLNGLLMKDAIAVANNKIEALGIGKRKVNFKMRDAGFSRQRYWGEPFPIIWKEGVAYPISENDLPLELPYVEKYGPGPEGEGPLANIEDWVFLPSPLGEGRGEARRETSTMPGYAGSSWYFLRYMDPHNQEFFCDKNSSDYWNQVDLYVGGTEHAVGHLLYSRMWTKVLFDLGYISFDEPFKRLLNQGMIQGSSRFVYRLISNYNVDYNTVVEIDKKDLPLIFISNTLYKKINLENQLLQKEIKELIDDAVNTIFHDKDFKARFLGNLFEVQRPHVNIDFVDGFTLDVEKFNNDLLKRNNSNNSIFIDESLSIKAFKNGSLILESGFEFDFLCDAEVEKMSKSKLNTQNPDELCDKYGADTFRMYEMFLGPIEQSKPWDTKGIEGVHRFLKKLWRLFFDETKGAIWNNEKPTNEDLKILHKTIKKVEEDTERFSFNTAVSAFMVCVNDLHDAKCFKKEILEQLVVLLTPYAPHIAEELWHVLANEGTVLDATFPEFKKEYVTESSKDYPVSINGKLRTTLTFSLEANQADIELTVLQNEIVQKWLEGKPPKKIIFIKGKMINVVI